MMLTWSCSTSLANNSRTWRAYSGRATLLEAGINNTAATPRVRWGGSIITWYGALSSAGVAFVWRCFLVWKGGHGMGGEPTPGSERDGRAVCVVVCLFRCCISPQHMGRAEFFSRSYWWWCGRTSPVVCEALFHCVVGDGRSVGTPVYYLPNFSCLTGKEGWKVVRDQARGNGGGKSALRTA
jgi:hypothetical protein